VSVAQDIILPKPLVKFAFLIAAFPSASSANFKNFAKSSLNLALFFVSSSGNFCSNPKYFFRLKKNPLLTLPRSLTF
jgi:hypothetical protein